MSKKFLQPHCGSGELSQNDSHGFLSLLFWGVNFNRVSMY